MWGATEGVRGTRERNAGEEVELGLEAGWEEGLGLGWGWGWDEAML